jgi:hypothetical protein
MERSGMVRGTSPSSTPGSSLRNTSVLVSDPSSSTISRQGTPGLPQSQPIHLSAYDARDDEFISPREIKARISAPEAIKVIKKKKKKGKVRIISNQGGFGSFD